MPVKTPNKLECDSNINYLIFSFKLSVLSYRLSFRLLLYLLCFLLFSWLDLILFNFMNLFSLVNNLIRNLLLDRFFLCSLVFMNFFRFFLLLTLLLFDFLLFNFLFDFLLFNYFLLNLRNLFLMLKFI